MARKPMTDSQIRVKLGKRDTGKLLKTLARSIAGYKAKQKRTRIHEAHREGILDTLEFRTPESTRPTIN